MILAALLNIGSAVLIKVMFQTFFYLPISRLCFASARSSGKE